MGSRRQTKDDAPSWAALTYAPNQPIAELVCNLLEDAGIPSFHRRAQGFDVPDFLAGGPRIVMVRAADLDAARQVADPFDWKSAPGDEAQNAR